MNERVTLVSEKDFVVTLILAILLGIFGIHDFYVGKAGRGILKLLTANIFGIGWIIDLINIASQTYKDGADLPIKAKSK